MALMGSVGVGELTVCFKSSYGQNDMDNYGKLNLTWPMGNLFSLFGMMNLVGKLQCKLNFFSRVNWLSEEWIIADSYMGVEPKIVVPQNGWFIMENPMNKWMIWGYKLFLETPI